MIGDNKQQVKSQCITATNLSALALAPICNGDKRIMPDYRERLTPWAIVRLLPNMQRFVAGRFRTRSDADGHLQFLRQHIPNGNFIVVFDFQPSQKR